MGQTMAAFSFEPSDTEQVLSIIDEHIESLAHPMDSWLEDRLLACEKYEIWANGQRAGYCGRTDNTLSFFYVSPLHFRHAPLLMEEFISRHGIERVFVMTQDTAVCSLIAEWDYDIERQACFFVDSGETPKAASAGVFRTAEQRDCKIIREVCGDFFDDASCGFESLEQRTDAGTIFMLEQDGELLGCGIVEQGIFCKGSVSIGMFTNPAHRRKGAAGTILIRLKEWAYNSGLRPVAGCWYYNTVSRKSLESAGMIAASKGFEAILKAKEKLPLRTGNPPGELLE